PVSGHGILDQVRLSGIQPASDIVADQVWRDSMGNGIHLRSPAISNKEARALGRLLEWLENVCQRMNCRAVTSVTNPQFSCLGCWFQPLRSRHPCTSATVKHQVRLFSAAAIATMQKFEHGLLAMSPARAGSPVPD